MPYVKVRNNNWIAEAETCGQWYVVLTDLDGLSLSDAQAALDAQYGKGVFKGHPHGTVHVFHNIPRYEKQTGRKYSQQR